jgi:hypothetical protein
VKLAPSIPSGYYSWGLALAGHADLPGAAAKFKDANLKGPHWADPLKAWGDVLAKQDSFKEALAKYGQALKYVPNWKQLKEACEALTKQKTQSEFSESDARKGQQRVTRGATVRSRPTNAARSSSAKSGHRQPSSRCSEAAVRPLQ